MEVISSIYNSGNNIKKFYLGSRELNLAYLGNQVIYDEVIGDNDLNYILYEFYGSDTLPNTVEAPVKRAILKGQTLVNILPSVNDDRFLIKNSTTLERLEDGFLRINAPHKGRWEIVTNTIPIKPSTKYLLITEVKNNTVDGLVTLANVTGFTTNNLTKVSVGFNGVLKQIITTKDVLSEYVFQGWLDSGSSGFVDIRNTLIEYQDGIENWDIPYFEGMKSVQMPVLTTTGKNIVDDTILKQTNLNINSNTRQIPIQLMAGDYFIGLTLSNNASPNSSYFAIRLWDKDFKLARTFPPNTVRTISLEESAKIAYMDVYTNGKHDYGDVYIKNFWVAKSSSATPYEPYKTNILTVNEPIELRGIGNVQDTLDCLTGEVTQRVGEIKLGNFDVISYSSTMFEGYYTAVLGINNKASSSLIMSNLVPTRYFNNSLDCGIYNNPTNITLFKKGATLEEIKNLVSNLIVQYQLAEKSVKTVDLTIVDQDGKTINKLNSFNGTTYVSTEVAENSAYPMVSLEVASELQAAMSKVAVDIELIKPVQNDIETTIDTQSNDIDSLLLATTELFEMFL